MQFPQSIFLNTIPAGWGWMLGSKRTLRVIELSQKLVSLQLLNRLAKRNVGFLFVFPRTPRSLASETSNSVLENITT
jgi:hypothetical protein